MKLKTLALGTGILVLLAVVAFGVNRWAERKPSHDAVGRPLMPALDMAQVARIAIVSPDRQITLNTTDGADWTVGEQENFPVSTRHLNQMLFKLANGKLAHKVTDNPERLGELGLLTAEENGGKREQGKTGVLISLEGKDGKPVYQVILGNDRKGEGQGAVGGTFVRFPAEKAAYLVSESVVNELSPPDWIDRVVFDEEADKVLQAITIRKTGQPPLELSRDKPETPWRVSGLAPEQVNQEETRSLANQIAALDIYRVAPGNSDPAAMGRKTTGLVEVRFFDKRAFTIDIGEQKGQEDFRYLTLAARLDPAGQDEALRKKVDAFNQRYRNRLLAVYDWDGGRLLRERKDFIAKDETNAKKKP
jgi:hypothetical protein